MTPKEKAIDLYEKFYFPCWGCDEVIKAKKCALVAVDEVRNNLPLISDIQQYWIEVKQEIEKL
jgi:hypothetical protein